MNLAGRSFLELADFAPDELRGLLDLAAALKREKREGNERRRLSGRNLALIFEKGSTRTRAAFEVAAYDQGACVSLLDSGSSHLGEKESVADTARVLGRFYDGIAFRGRSQADVATLARASGVPVWNALTDEYHPTQVLADALTMAEGAGELAGTSCCYLGDARFNMGNSLLMGAAKLGLDFRIAAPEAYWPRAEHRVRCEAVAAETGARLTYTERLDEGVDGAAFLYTDVWVSMGEPDEVWETRVRDLRPYRVDAAAMAATGRDDSLFLHCLPAYHDTATGVGRRIAERYGLDGLEVSHEVFESPRSVVFEQAENRLHTIKALIVATLGCA